MRRAFHSYYVGLVLLGAVAAHGQGAGGRSHVTVVGAGGGGKLAFSLSSLRADSSSEAQQMKQTLQRDLERSGWFVDGGPRATIQISGSARGGDPLQLEVVPEPAHVGMPQRVAKLLFQGNVRGLEVQVQAGLTVNGREGPPLTLERGRVVGALQIVERPVVFLKAKSLLILSGSMRT